jgi:AraC-like DNA-binding protein
VSSSEVVIALDGCRVVRPDGFDGAIEITAADPRPRAFPARISPTLGICIKRGAAHEVRTGGRAVVYPADAICIRPPGTVWASEAAAVEFLAIDIAAEAVPLTLRGPMRFAAASELPGIAGAIARVAGGDGLLARQEAAAELIDLAVRHDRGAGALEAGDAARTVARAIDFLHARFADQPSLAEVADAADANRFVLVRRFRQRLGLTPHEYLVQVRLARARELLARGVAAAEVAHLTGFADQPHLTRWFKRALGVTPVRYARTVRTLG